MKLFYTYFLFPQQVKAAPSISQNDTPQSVRLSGRGICPKQRSLPDIKQYLRKTDVHASTGFKPALLASSRPQTIVLDHSVTEIATLIFYITSVYYILFLIAVVRVMDLCLV